MHKIIFKQLLPPVFLNLSNDINKLFNTDPFNCHNKTSIEYVMIMRLPIHLFIRIAPSPYDTKRESNSINPLISMPPDMLALVHNAIENKEIRIWLCPKGHPYLVESKFHCHIIQLKMLNQLIITKQNHQKGML